MSRTITTDRELYALKPEPARYERAVGKARGLSVLGHPNGRKIFVLRYVAKIGARRRLPLGDYAALSLAEARLKAQALSSVWSKEGTLLRSVRRRGPKRVRETRSWISPRGTSRPQASSFTEAASVRSGQRRPGRSGGASHSGVVQS